MFTILRLHILVQSGGNVFHAYLNLASTSKTHAWWIKRSRKRSQGKLIPLTSAEMDRVQKAESTFFHGFVLQSVHLSGSARGQLFYPTFAAGCHGLSKSGMDILAGYGFCTPHTSYQRLRSDLIATAERKVRFFNLAFKLLHQ